MKKIFIIAIVLFLLILFLAPFLFGPTRPPNYGAPDSNKTQFSGKTSDELKSEGE
jgi:hypothetical protein